MDNAKGHYLAHFEYDHTQEVGKNSCTYFHITDTVITVNDADFFVEFVGDCGPNTITYFTDHNLLFCVDLEHSGFIEVSTNYKYDKGEGRNKWYKLMTFSNIEKLNQ